MRKRREIATVCCLCVRVTHKMSEANLAAYTTFDRARIWLGGQKSVVRQMAELLR